MAVKRKEPKEDIEYEDITVEKLHELYLNDERLRPNYQLYRLNTNRGRIYFKEKHEGGYTLYLGTTSVGKLLPMEDALLRWFAYHGVDESWEYIRQRGVYGSFMHTVYGDYFIMGEVNLTELPDRLKNYMVENKVPLDLFEAWSNELKCDTLAFIQWVNDYNIQPIMIEAPLCSEANGVATLVDCVCFQWDKKYTDKTPIEDRKQILSIVDFKSGKSGFYKANRIQLVACAEIFSENYPQLPPITEYYNFAPKHFKGNEPTYAFSRQTDKINPDEYTHYIELAKIKLKDTITRPVRVIQGTIKRGDNPQNFILDKSIEDLINENHWQKFLKEELEKESATT